MTMKSYHSTTLNDVAEGGNTEEPRRENGTSGCQVVRLYLVLSQ